MGFQIDLLGTPPPNPCAANASGLSMGILLTSIRPNGTRGRNDGRVEVNVRLEVEVEGSRREHAPIDLPTGIMLKDMVNRRQFEVVSTLQTYMLCESRLLSKNSRSRHVCKSEVGGEVEVERKLRHFSGRAIDKD
jgi:hypothetical protein